MLRRLSLAAFVLVLSLNTLEAGPRRAVSVGPRFDVPAARTAVQAAMSGGVPGAVVAVRHHGATYVEAFGLRDKEAGTPMQWDAILPLASVSKQFTAAAILRLAEEGRLRTSDPIRMYLPELGAAYEPITIEHLLTHTAGLPDYDTMLTDLHMPVSQAEMVKLITSKPLEFTPGSSWSYSNSGFFLAAMIVERITGQRFDFYLEQTFFAPLAMTSTSECSNVPDGYIKSPFDGTISRFAMMHPSQLTGAGSLCSSALDLLQWNQALVSGLAMTPQSFAKMRSNLRLSNGQPLPYGYGLATDPLDNKYARIWHNGLVPGYMSHVAFYPDLDLSVAVLVNLSLGKQDYASTIANAIARSFAK